MKNLKTTATLLIALFTLSVLAVAMPVSATTGITFVDFGPTGRTPSLEGTISYDDTNLYFHVTVLGQDAADDDYLAFWIDPDYLNKGLSGMSSQFDSPWNEHNKLLMLNFFTGNTDPEWGDGTGGNCPWMQKSKTLPTGVSLTYTDTTEGMDWEGTIPLLELGMSAGDTFGYMFAARINTDDKYVDGYPEMVFGVTPGWDLRDYNTVTIPSPSAAVSMNAESAGYMLTVQIEGMGSVTPEPKPEGYFHGETVTLTATPVLGWHFGHWEGIPTGRRNNPLTVTMDSDKTLTAVFVLDVVSISVYPTSVDFGTVIMGTTSNLETVKITNEGNVMVEIDATVDAGFFGSYLRLDNVPVGDWSDLTKNIDVGGKLGVSLVLDLTGYRDVGGREGTLVFWAEKAP